MVVLLVFALALLLAVWLSELADRSILSTAVLFLVVGVTAGHGGLQVIRFAPTEPVVGHFAELALFSILYIDGMRLSLRDLTSAWRLPGRALVFGMPLTLLATAALAHWVIGLTWAESFLLGAVLCPTDPVFASAIIGREEVPQRLRHLLNVESGVNDGLALPLVITMLAVIRDAPVDSLELAREVGLGILLGVVIPWAAVFLGRLRVFATHSAYQPLFGLAVGLIVLATTKLLHANAFLAAFAAGITLATVSPEARHNFHRFGELLAEVLKLAALLIFGALMTLTMLDDVPVHTFLFVILALVLARPLAIGIALFRSEMPWRERVAAGWFGPKGFASVVFALWVFRAGSQPEFGWVRADRLYNIAALVIAASMIAHSSTDILVARWFRSLQPDDDSASSVASEPETEPNPDSAGVS